MSRITTKATVPLFTIAQMREAYEAGKAYALYMQAWDIRTDPFTTDRFRWLASVVVSHDDSEEMT